MKLPRISLRDVQLKTSCLLLGYSRSSQPHEAGDQQLIARKHHGFYPGDSVVNFVAAEAIVVILAALPFGGGLIGENGCSWLLQSEHTTLAGGEGLPSWQCIGCLGRKGLSLSDQEKHRSLRRGCETPFLPLVCRNGRTAGRLRLHNRLIRWFWQISCSFIRCQANSGPTLEVKRPNKAGHVNRQGWL